MNKKVRIHHNCHLSLSTCSSPGVYKWYLMVFYILEEGRKEGKNEEGREGGKRRSEERNQAN